MKSTNDIQKNPVRKNKIMNCHIRHIRITVEYKWLNTYQQNGKGRNI